MSPLNSKFKVGSLANIDIELLFVVRSELERRRCFVPRHTGKRSFAIILSVQYNNKNDNFTIKLKVNSEVTLESPATHTSGSRQYKSQFKSKHSLESNNRSVQPSFTQRKALCNMQSFNDKSDAKGRCTQHMFLRSFVPFSTFSFSHVYLHGNL